MADMTWFRNDRPSRAINVDATPAAVGAMCGRKGATISAIERLADGGTHVVLTTMDEADTIRHAFRDKLLPRTAKRVPLRHRGYD